MRTQKRYGGASQLFPMKRHTTRRVAHCSAFTLVELSIVIVAVGLVAGGVLVGRDLIDAAKLRSQMSQIEQYRVAVGDFKTTYGGQLPGDIKASVVNRMNFTAGTNSGMRNGGDGRGDGDGTLEGVIITPGTTVCNPICHATLGSVSVVTHLSSGENAFFWADLTTNSKLISDAFTTITDNTLTSSDPANYVPKAKLGNKLFVYSYSKDNVNYLGLSMVDTIDGNGALRLNAGNRPGITVAQAFGIDSKMDDGLPQSGAIIARYQNWSNQGAVTGGAANGPGEPRWASGLTTGVACGNGGALDNSGTCGTSWGYSMAATVGSAETCYDNGNVAGAVQRYSIGQNGGQGPNCGLSFMLEP